MSSTVGLTLRSSIIAALGVSATAGAQNAAGQAPNVEEIVVTGSSLRGVAPVGSNLVTVGRGEIENTGAQTVQQILKTVPSVVGLQSAGQAAYGSFDGAGTNAPTIHGLGASASNSTLILLNGHRMPVSGINHVLADPNIVAPLALERVEVLADGASSVYGSDAVAGVVNFITRRNVDGIEASVQTGAADGYGTVNAGVLGGTTWSGGSLLVSYNYSDRDNLDAVDRDYVRANQTARGGRDFTPNRCGPASITVAGQTYYTPYTAAGAIAGDCDPSLHADLLASERRHSVFATIEQDVTARLTLTGDLIYSQRENDQAVPRGNASATMFGPGAANAAQINPFFRLPTGVAAGTSSIAVNFSGDALLGPGAHIESDVDTVYGRFDADYELTDTWSFNAGFLIGLDSSRQQNFGQLCGSCFNLAINGTTNGGGSTTAASIPGTTTVVLNTPLTAANALDPFANGTSDAVRAALMDSGQIQVGDQVIKNLYFKFDGDLFDMRGGAAQLAVGGELIDYELDQDIVRPNNTGPASTGSAQLFIPYARDVTSAYAELYLPFVGPEQDVPGVNSFAVNLSTRYDDYSDVGSTTNPKIAFNWGIVEALMLRANYAEAFVAPALTSRGANQFGLTGESGFSGIAGQGLAGGPPTIATASFPSAIGIPGCPAGSATCSLNNVTGLLLTGGSGTLQPQTGKSWSLGVDITPPNVQGLRVSLTKWTNELRGGITAPVPSLALGSADLSSLIQFFPTGATAAQIAAAAAGLPQTGALNASTFFFYNFQQRNVLNLDVAGLDVAVSYEFDAGGGSMNVGAALTHKTKFDQFFGANGTKFSVLGTAGFNTTFPSVEDEGRLSFGYEREMFSINAYYNYLGSYRNWSGTAAIQPTRVAGLPSGGGGDPVDSFATVDVNVAFQLEKMELFLDALNLFDEEPPQYNTFAIGGNNGVGVAGYDPINASPLGRVLTVGLRARF
ncbi:MAG TPA: TonB-dependent receptor [Gammaproteobacteria bacterium]|nr:TonB-dependent receptor [Gammaproteobacteria bacterium]